MSAVDSFEFQVPTRLVFGARGLDRLGELAQSLETGPRVLVISDPGIVAAGHVEQALDRLRGAGFDTALFDQAHVNPTDADVNAGVHVAREFRPDLLVGLGGGSSLDCAKGINFVYSCGGTIHDYWGVGKATGPLLPLVGVPTTAGTGSEMQSFALISDAQTHVKMACGDRRAACRIAIVDPLLTLTQPPALTALTGIDALSHALETFVTRRRNALSLLFSREAWRLGAGAFHRVLARPDDLAARTDMQLAAALAGVAIEHSMLGAAHALANPLTAAYGTAHGQAVGVMLPHVIRYNAHDVDDWYRDVLAVSEGVDGAPPRSAGATGLAEFITRMLARAGLATRLSECGVQREHLNELATAASRQWTGQFNPRSVDQSSLRALYEQAL